ncbi:response regulator [Rhodoferax sp. AJA081-3]|uniref:response regulator n=1 Tax=Rhodoferax sp. AJA081-3 TaxID=2752316 RepID=UPI001ADF09EF|nr:response regulator [Rhodoferax sp. AJA081-3]QTN29887.1 response regulator [Rhodoferax sp. AJA081-3]
MITKKKYTAAPEHAHSRILVFNDSAVDVTSVVNLLEGMGYRSVTPITDPRHLLSTLSASPFDALLVDLRMPHLDGLKAIYLIRETFSAAELPILAISDDGLAELCNAGLLAGANDHVVRPIDPIDVALRVRNLLTIHDIYKTSQDIKNNLEREVQARTAKLNMLIENGLLMSMTRDRTALIRHTLFEGRRLLHCDAATLYLRTDRQTLRFSMRTRGDQLADKELPLLDDATGLPNGRYAATWCANHKQTLRIDNVYAEDRFDLTGTRSFDEATGFKTVSTLTVPLIPRGGQVVGVLQFINKLDADTGAVVPFPPELEPLVEALAAQAAVTLANLALQDAQLARAEQAEAA